MNPQNYGGQQKPTAAGMGQPMHPMAYGMPPSTPPPYSANPHMGFYGKSPQQLAEDWMRSPDNPMSMLWRPYASALMAARNSQRVPQPPRGDFAPPTLHDLDTHYLMGRRPMYPGSPYGAQSIYSQPYPVEFLAQLQNSNITTYIRDQELRHNAHFKKDDMTMPLVVEPRNRPKYISLDSEFLISSWLMIPMMNQKSRRLQTIKHKFKLLRKSQCNLRSSRHHRRSRTRSLRKPGRPRKKRFKKSLRRL